MNIIKFNAWDKFEKKMIYWDDLIKTKESEKLIAEVLLNSVRYIPLQYSNRNDLIDQELYVGDVVKATENKDSETLGEVIFKDYSYCIKWKNHMWGEDFMWELNWNDSDFTIVKEGNIYEGLKIDL
jgi:hypothetical protein